MQVPEIDFNNSEVKNIAALCDGVDNALSNIGFMTVNNLGIDAKLLAAVFSASFNFFHGSVAVKNQSVYESAGENFGYQGFGRESLDPSKAVDLKETFTMRNVLGKTPEDGRWPSIEFRDLMLEFYKACLSGAHQMARVLARALNVEPEFFVNSLSGENVTLRLLYYPNIGAKSVSKGQLGAGEHTDYGLLTLLFQDDVGGLQVLDSKDEWQDVECREGAIVINSGDMLERWTNGRYRSTLHRVQPKIGDQERFSIAFFVDPDDATPVAVLDSCVSAENPARFDEITAGEHLQKRIEATHLGTFTG